MGGIKSAVADDSGQWTWLTRPLRVTFTDDFWKSVTFWKTEKEFGSITKNLEKVHENDLLNKLIEKSSIKDEPILVINNEKKNIGVITQADLLKAVVEGSDGE